MFQSQMNVKATDAQEQNWTNEIASKANKQKITNEMKPILKLNIIVFNGFYYRKEPLRVLEINLPTSCTSYR